MELIEQKFMKSIVIIGCYFGTLRKDTAMFLRSIQANPTIDWLFFSDCDWGKVPDNVKIVNMSFEKLKELVQSHFDFQISLEAPYKLCDFRPAYGDIFKDYAEKYDFWGHCDFDMIFGNLRKFFNEDKLEKYDRIYYQGHLSIYRNIEKICKLYQSDKGPQYYKDVFTTSISCVFDEVDGMYPIFVKENVPIYSEVQCIDVYPYLDVMFHTRREFAISKQFPVNYSKQVFGYEDGGVYKWFMKDGTVEKEVDIDCGAGSVTLNLEGKVEDYNYELDSSAGSIEIGEDIDLGGLSTEKSIDNGSKRTIEISNGAGSVEIRFH